jgi:hypothetical protein
MRDRFRFKHRGMNAGGIEPHSPPFQGLMLNTGERFSSPLRGGEAATSIR